MITRKKKDRKTRPRQDDQRQHSGREVVVAIERNKSVRGRTEEDKR